MPEPEWLTSEVVLEIHRRNLIRYGGTAGLRDSSLLESALARPQWLYKFDSNADLHRIAAAYTFGIVKNHPFVDGNKRVAFLSAYVFLRFNGWHIVANQRDVERVMLALAGGEMNEDQFCVWLKENSQRTEPAVYP